MSHTPVMVSQTLTYLLHEDPRIIVDCTVGAGGHAEAVLESHPSVRLIGIDRDPTALRVAKDRLARFGSRVRLVHGVYSDLDRALNEEGRADGVLLDLGLSSMQLDDPGRGFSYSVDEPLDMRMSQTGITAADWLAGAEVSDIAEVFRRNADVRQAKRIAPAVKAAVDAGAMRTTGDLKTVVQKTLGSRATPAELSRVFQAVRIKVNDELNQLDSFFGGLVGCMNPGGRIVVISYHSLEDRVVKSYFKLQSASCTCPPEAPVCTCARSPVLRVLTRRVVKPTAAEVAENVRARSARLRAAEVLRVEREQ
ncbi:MAG: 16S rRNA (cytosine(1402)-N(4))-methyltransferase RsmH [Candidatus Latescibacterota bacterium]|jgi:16S rRNA (cytosine1402-N4)-methyltransferase